MHSKQLHSKPHTKSPHHHAVKARGNKSHHNHIKTRKFTTLTHKSRQTQQSATLFNKNTVFPSSIPTRYISTTQQTSNHITSQSFSPSSITKNKPFAISKRHFFIQTMDTPNPLSQKFITTEPLLTRVPDAPASVSFDASERNTTARSRSELAYTILCLEGVSSVMLCDTFLTVTVTDSSVDWLLVKPGVYAAISDALATEGSDAIYKPSGIIEPSREKPTLPGDEETVELIKEIIDHRIRPILLNDGGDIEFIELDKERTLWLMMKGSCDGCPSSANTLHDGIQNMILHYVPEVEQVKEYKEPLLTIGQDAFDRLEEKLASLEKDSESTKQ